ncbi:MAG: type II toxin-antitoxin system RelE/ParE family toxin [Pseudomonadota bacterium]
MPQVKLEWTPQALADVQRLYRFLLHKNPDAARRAVKAIRANIGILAYQPHLGRLVEDLEPEYREWPIDFGSDGYMALYRLDGQKAVILALRHQKEAGY